jgi:hypothetical protein
LPSKFTVTICHLNWKLGTEDEEAFEEALFELMNQWRLWKVFARGSVMDPEPVFYFLEGGGTYGMVNRSAKKSRLTYILFIFMPCCFHILWLDAQILS